MKEITAFRLIQVNSFPIVNSISLPDVCNADILQCYAGEDYAIEKLKDTQSFLFRVWFHVFTILPCIFSDETLPNQEMKIPLLMRNF